MASNVEDDFGRAMDVIVVWLAAIKDFPGFSEWKLEEIGVVMSYGDLYMNAPEQHSTEFLFPPHLRKQHAAITAFFNLHTTWQALEDTQYYFRRYPFKGLPINLETHLRYCCEGYFSRIYEFSERLKRCLNSLNEVLPRRIEAGALIKQFGKEFRRELIQRNSIHHHESFDEIIIRRIYLEGVLASDDEHGLSGRDWKVDQRRTYRKASREWADRVARRSACVRAYVNAVSRLISDECKFLTEPIAVH